MHELLLILIPKRRNAKENGQKKNEVACMNSANTREKEKKKYIQRKMTRYL